MSLAKFYNIEKTILANVDGRYRLGANTGWPFVDMCCEMLIFNQLCLVANKLPNFVRSASIRKKLKNGAASKLRHTVHSQSSKNA